MKLNLIKLPVTLRGIYGPRKVLGPQQLFAHPVLETSIAALESAGVRLVFSDIFRSAKGSLDARRAKPGLVQPPGYSAHNFGLAADIDVSTIMKELGLDKKRLDELLAAHGLFCHRTDHALASEAWHYNALGPNGGASLQAGAKSTAGAVEAKIMHLYGLDFEMTVDQIKGALCSLTGDLEKQAKIKASSGLEFAAYVREFQVAWDLVVDGVAGARTKRTLALVTATRSA